MPRKEIRVASAGNTAVTTSDSSTWRTFTQAVAKSASGSPAARQRVQQSMVATVLGLALITSLVSGIGWFATQQLLSLRARKADPYQVILRREVVDLAKPDAQMCGELCRTGQGLIGEIHGRVDEIQGAAPLRRVLLREVRSMEQFLATTIQAAPDDPREWRRMRLRLQRVVTDLIRLKDITDGARRSLTTYIALVYGAGMVTLIVILLVARQPMFGFSLEAYGWVLALALGPQIIGHSTLNWALRHLSATFVSIVTLAEPIGSGLLAYLVLGEAVTGSTLVGGIVLLTGIYIASRAEMGTRST